MAGVTLVSNLDCVNIKILTAESSGGKANV